MESLNCKLIDLCADEENPEGRKLAHETLARLCVAIERTAETNQSKGKVDQPTTARQTHASKSVLKHAASHGTSGLARDPS